MRANIYIAVSSCSPQKSMKHYAYVLETTINGAAKTKEGFGSIDGTYYQATMAALEDSLKRFRKPCEIYVASEDSFTLQVLGNYLPTWAENDFKGKQGKEVKNREVWERIWNLSRKHQIQTLPGKHIYSDWLKDEMRRKENV